MNSKKTIIVGNQEDIDNVDRINITWALTYKCNLNCSYCNTRNVICAETSVDKIFSYLRYQSERKKCLEVLLYGGEPTLYSNLRKVLDFCEDVCPYYEMYTNFMSPISTYKQLMHYSHLTIRGTIHNRINDSMIDIFNLFDKEKLFVNIILNEYAMESIYFLESEDIRFEISSVNDTCSIDDFEIMLNYNRFDLQESVSFVYSDNSFDVEPLYLCKHRKINNFIDWKCLAGDTYQFITPDGYVYPCEAYSKNRKTEYLYNLNTDYNFNKDLPTLCKQLCVDCELSVPKYNVFRK